MDYIEKIFGIKDKVAVVTGGSQGIGQTVAIGIAKAGAQVVILCRSYPEKTLKIINEFGGSVSYISTDITDEDSVIDAFHEIECKFGGAEIVFNNAGVCIHQLAEIATVDQWKSVIDVNLNGTYIVCRTAGKLMIRKGIRGSIINNASMSGTVVNVPQGQCSYNSSKAGVIHLTKSLAVEWANYGIRVNSLSPGYIATPMSVDTPQELKNAWIPLIPMKRMGQPEELIGAVIYLASNASAYTTGSNIIVDGGYVCR